ncbi:MAG: gliding motility-associated C-terminal domain-containing protein [Spirochaetes bacterium]|nr:gliding motility-associated C-terminal domain-containing protein [Spirochaetota bacterium]
MVRKTTAIIVFVVTALIAEAATMLPGSQLLYLGQGANGLALGGNGITQFGNIEGIFYNPAVAGDIRRVSATLSGGSSGIAAGNHQYWFGGVSLPTRFGVWSGGATLLTSPESSSLSNVNIGTVIGLNAALSKRINDFVFLGFGLRGYFGMEKTLGNDFGINADIGVYFKTFPNLEDISFTASSNTNNAANTNAVKQKGLGLYDFAAGIALRNIFVFKTLSYGTNYLGSEPVNVGLGASVKLLKIDWFKLGLLGDITMPIYPFNVNGNLGMELSFFDVIFLRGGLLLTATNFGLPYTGFWTGGLGFSFKRTPIFGSDIKLDFAVVPQSYVTGGTSQDYGIFGTLGVGFGYYDDVPPKIEFATSNTYFSPNFDGSQDTVSIVLGIKDNEMVNGWMVAVKDEKGEVIKEFVSQDKLKESLTAMKFFERIAGEEQEVIIPKSVEWDGIDKNGKQVKDGTYTYTVSAWDKNNNTNTSRDTQIFIDRVFPEVKLAAEPELIFSPNGDGNKDIFAVSNTVKMKQGDVATGRIVNDKGETIRTFVYSNAMPALTEWDGKMDNGADAPEGAYGYKVEVKNLAGNNLKNEIKMFRLVRRIETVSVSSDLADFSPNSDGTMDTVRIGVNASSTTDLAQWRLDILDKKGVLRKQFKGTSDLPESLIWDGSGNDGKTLPDGEYRYAAALRYTSGNRPESATNSIVIDTTAPTVRVKASSRAFGGETKSTITFANDYDPTTTKSNDTFEFSVRNDKGTVVFLKDETVASFPAEITWNGFFSNNSSMERVPDGMYVYSVRSKDPVGNSKTIMIENISLDTGKKKVEIDNDTGTFSPNRDGKKDTINFILRVSDTQTVASWAIEIVDAAKTPVYSITGGKELHFGYEWDGRDANGKLVADGQFRYRLTVNYSAGQVERSLVKSFFVDTKPPAVAVAINDKVFSPNGDGKKETLTIEHTMTSPALSPERFEGVVKDTAGRAVRRFSFKGVPPASFSWDGRDQSGTVAKQGVYSYELSAEDDGENTTNIVIPGIRVVTDFEKLTVAAGGGRFSPNGDGVLDTIKITSSATSLEGMTAWKMIISDSAKKTVQALKGTRADFPKETEWNGKDAEGRMVADGTYTVTLAVRYDSGNEIESSINIVADLTAPVVKLTVHPKVFSPDGDGDNDRLFLNFDIDDPSGVAAWQADIYQVVDGVVGTNAFKTFKGTGALKELMQWDGYGNDAPAGTKDDKYLAESASDYAVVVRVADTLGNTAVMRPVPFYVDILVIPTPYGYKIRISSIQFDVDKWDIKSKYEPILTRLAQILNKFKQHKVRIEGHTDMTGPHEHNIELSKKRAGSVFNYLVERGLAAERFTVEGLGKTRPVFEEKADDPNLTDNRARNRRVEFYLQK